MLIYICTMFGGWWDRISKEVAVVLRKGLNSLVILGAWTLWIHRNTCAFDDASPSVPRALVLAVDELHFWDLARAQGITHLLALAPPES